MDLLTNLLVHFLIFGLVGLLISYAPFDERVKRIAYFVLLVVFVLVMVRLLLGGGRIVVV